MSAISFIEFLKHNPYHGKDGRFTSANQAATVTTAFKPASTIEEAKEYAKTQLGFSGYVDYGYSYIDQKEVKQVSGTLDLDTVNHINEAITNIQSKYPELKGAVENLGCTNANVYAAVVFSQRDASASLMIGAKAYKDGKQKVFDAWQEDVELGYHPKGTDGNSVFWHEYGHVYAAQSNRQPNNTRNTMNAINNSVAESKWKNTAAERMGVDADSLGKNISRYATVNDAELFAEAFAAYNTGAPNKWAKAIVEAADASGR